MPTVIIATDNKPLREALTAIILSHPHYTLAGVCADSHAAIAIASAENPHIVLIDGSSDPLAVTAATKKICSCTSAGVIVLSQNADDAFAQHVLAAGALGYLTHHSPAAEILIAIEQVTHNNVYLCQALLTRQKKTYVAIPAAAGIRHWTVEHSPMATRRYRFREKLAAAATQWHKILRFTN